MLQQQLADASNELKNRPFVTHYPGEKLQLEMNRWVHWKVEGESMRISDNARYSNVDRALNDIEGFL